MLAKSIFILLLLFWTTTTSLLINAQIELLCEQVSTLNCECNNGNTNIDCSSNKYGQNSKLEIFNEEKLTQADFSSNLISEIKTSSDVFNLKILNLRNNKIKSLSYENQFEHLINLLELNLANNYIETIDIHTFEHLQHLAHLNLSNSGSFRLTTHLCSLTSLKSLDLSYLDLSELDLSCWDNNAHQQMNGLIEELYLKNSKNAFKNSWFQYIGTSLKYLDLTNTSLVTIFPGIFQHQSLSTLILSNNQNLNQTQLSQVLTNTSLTRIDIAQINATSTSLNLKTLIQNKPSTLTYIDISSNSFTDYDINEVIVDVITKLNTFIGTNNQFISSLEFNATLNNFLESNTKLQVLNLSGNKLNSTILNYIQYIRTLNVLDLSNNSISLPAEDFITNKIVSLFSRMPNLTDVNLSNNRLIRFITYFNESSLNIKTFDISHNKLEKFYILSKNIISESTFPINLRPLNNQSLDDFDVDDSSETTVHDFSDTNRFINMGLLDLSSNSFAELNFRKQFKSIKNINRLDASFNSKLKNIGILSYKSIEINNLFSNNTNNKPLDQLITDNGNKLLLINELDLENCQINEIPSFEYTIFNKISLAGNNLNGTFIIKLSLFSINFLKYINLMKNNINNFIVSVVKNREILEGHYKLNSSLTYIDAKLNKDFECDCSALKELETTENLRVMSDCDETNDCANSNILNDNSNSGIFSNRRVTFLVIIICAIIIVLAILIVYSLFSDIRNLRWITIGNVLLCCKLKFARQNDNSNEESEGSSLGRLRSRVPYVRLSRPNENDNLEIEGF